MPGATPTYALPYPVGADPVADGDNIMQALAEAVEDVLEAEAAARLAGDAATLADARTVRTLLRATDLNVVSGAGGALTFRNRVPVWRFPDGATVILGTLLLVPAGWATMHVDLWWTNAQAAAGNVSWRLDLGPMVEGQAVPDPASGSGVPTVDLAAPADGIVKRSRLATGLACTPGPNSVEIMRHGGLAGDTVAGQVSLLALEFTRAA